MSAPGGADAMGPRGWVSLEELRRKWFLGERLSYAEVGALFQALEVMRRSRDVLVGALRASTGVCAAMDPHGLACTERVGHDPGTPHVAEVNDGLGAVWSEA